MNVEVVASGHVTRDDAAYPSLVGLDDGAIVCGYSCGGGSSATGGTDWARSTDGGTTWTREGTILGRTEGPVTTNSLRLSRTAGGTVLAYGARRYDTAGKARFGERSLGAGPQQVERRGQNLVGARGPGGRISGQPGARL